MGLEDGGFDTVNLRYYKPWDPIRDRIKDILLSRKMKPEHMDDRISGAIISAIVGAEDKCTCSFDV